MRGLAAAASMVVADPGTCRMHEDCRETDGGPAVVHAPGLSPEKEGAVRRAAMRWNGLAGREVIAVDDADGEPRCTLRQLSSPTVEGDQAKTRAETGNIDVGAWYNCEPDEPRGDEPRCFEMIVAHEFGHLLGMRHGGPGVMRGSGGAAYEFSGADRAQCRAIGLCR